MTSMQLCRKFLCILIAAFLIIPFSVAAEEVDHQAYSDLFRSGTHEEWNNAFKENPRLFISALSEEEYGRMISVVTFTFAHEDMNKNGDNYRQTLLLLAQQNELNQAERRVVRWMLNTLGMEYDMWAKEVDFRELFSRCAEMDGALPAYYSEELKEVFLMDPYRFLQEMSDSDADPEHLATLLMDRIYYGNYDWRETEELLQGLESSGKLNDAQLQMLQQLRRAVDGLIELYGPLPEQALDNQNTQQAEIPTDTTEPAPKQPTNSVWLLPSIAILLIAVILVVCIQRKKHNRRK